MAVLLAAGMVTLNIHAAQAGTPHSANPAKWEHFSGLDGHNDPSAGLGAQYQMSPDAVQWWNGPNGDSLLPGWFNDATQWQTVSGRGYYIPKGAMDQTQWQVFTDGHLGGWQDSNKDGIHDMFESQATWNTVASSQLGVWLDNNRDGMHDAFQVWQQGGGNYQDHDKWYGDYDYGHGGGKGDH